MEDQPYAPAQPCHGSTVERLEILPFEQDISRARLFFMVDQFEQSRFARTIRTAQQNQFAFMNLKVDIVESTYRLRVALLDVLELDHSDEKVLVELPSLKGKCLDRYNPGC